VEPSSAELLERYRGGDESAATPLFVRYVVRLTAMVRSQMTSSLRRRIDPEDAVHSAYRSFFVRARNGQFTLQRSGELWKLLVTITLNKLRRQIAHHRAHKRAVQRDRAFGEFVDVAREPSPLEALAAADELAAFMARLNPLQRQVLTMRLQEERWEEIAKATGRSPRTVRRVLADVQRIWRDIAGSQGIGTNSLPEHTHQVTNSVENRVTNPSTIPEQVSGDRDSHLPASTPTAQSAALDYREFVLEKHLGSGGMGKVYRARCKSDDQRVAIKMLRKVRWTQPGAVERFMEEARTIGAMRHPGIVEVYGVGQTPGGGPFIVMEFIEGENLATIAARERPSPREAVAWIAEAAEALHHAHQHGIVHCDLKPSNLLREQTGRIVITDFGLAATRTPSGDYQLWGGTPAFMAPEQLDPAFGTISPATDVFALGLVLCNLISGRTLLAERPIIEVISGWNEDSAAARTLIGLTDVSPALAQIMNQCLAIHSDGRYPSAWALADALRTAK
jgi:eukaryotic-like serine/threonine-protein kinase